MSIYVIADLHLSFSVDKPMDVFGDNWENHAEKIKRNWMEKVKPEDTVILPGDFSWATYLEESRADFEFLNSLPGKKILSKGNHDYWWNSISKMKTFLKDNNFENIDFLHNNSFLIEDIIIAGTKGYNTSFKENQSLKILTRENMRLEFSIQDGIQKYGNDKEIVVFMHYPPFYKESVPEEIDFIKTLKKYNVGKCYYGHLHGDSHKEAIEGIIDDIEYKLISSDFLNFNLVCVKL